jgi:acetyl-CoA synthetase
MRVNKQRLIRCLNPCSIAVVGGKECERVLQQSQKLGFEGEMWAVNPRRESMAGIACFKSLEELPATPDVVFIGVPAEPTIDMVRQLNESGAGGAVCLASGFKEVGEDGQNRQQMLLEAAGDMPVLGPNCYGYINTLLGAALFPDQHGLTRTEQGVAIVSSSGNIGINFTLQQRGLPISWLITIGNQAVIGIEEAISAALENDRIKAIGLHIEGLNNLPLFIELASVARSRGIPIIVLKTGKSDSGARITMSHTGTLAGEAGLYEALFERLGIGLVNNIEEFLESLKLAWIVGPLKGNRISSMSCSGGEASLIADLSVSRDLEFPGIESDHRELLRSTLNDYVAIDNPLDYHTFIWGDPQRMTATFSAMMKGNYDLSILIIDFPYINNCDMQEWIDAAQAFVDACNQTGSKGAVVTCLSENYTDKIRDHLVSCGVAPLHGMEQALAAIETLSKIGRAWQLNAPLPEISVLSSAENVGDSVGLDEHKAKNFLASLGINIPVSRIVDDMVTCVKAGKEIGFPVVLKAISTEISHKSELGAVVLGIRNEKELREHAQRLQKISSTLLVEQQVDDCVAELLVGVSYDNLFGHYLILGFGGTLVELIGDRVILFFPVNDDQVREALKRLKTWPLLDGFRGRKKADIDGVVATIGAISRLIRAHGDRIVELEINPLMVRPETKGAVVADALIRVTSEF